ncbi:MAG: hypothetical protein ABIA47_02515 [bacterium]
MAVHSATPRSCKVRDIESRSVLDLLQQPTQETTMADVSDGPVTTLPGSSAPLPVSQMCDGYNCRCDKPATRRIQGETDSFGAEFMDLCDDCYRKYRADTPWYHDATCDWCKSEHQSIVPTRDIDEGSHGPVYYVCSKCKAKQDAAIERELEQYDNCYYDQW